MKKPFVNYNDRDLYLYKSKYANNDRIYLGLADKEGNLWGDITINLSDLLIEDDNYVFISGDLPTDLKEKIYDTGVFIDLYFTQKYNMGKYDKAMVNTTKLKEYVDEYTIQIWQTSEDRNQGYVEDYSEKYNILTEAVNMARNLYESNNPECIEIVDDEGHTIYNKDKESELFYLDNRKILFTNEKEIDKYINEWITSKSTTLKENLLYCYNGNNYIAIDNTSNECFVEEFNSEEEAHNYLLGLDLQKEEGLELS